MPVAGTESGCEIYYERHGSHGSPIVLIAGMGGSGRFWQPQINALSERYRVIAYDQAGTGRSSRGYSGALSVARMARDIAAVLDAEGIPAAHIVGHAIGGIIGLQFAATMHPRVLTLTVVNGWAQADAHLRRCFEVRKEILVRSGARAYLRAQPLFLFPPRWISENDHHLNAELSEMLAGFPGTEVMLGRIDTFLEFDATAVLGAISVPTLIMASSDDALVPSHLSEALVRGIRGARLQSFENGAHAFTVVYPERFNHALLTFLAEHDGSAESFS
jgi:aminoacrylate hydrolase